MKLGRGFTGWRSGRSYGIGAVAFLAVLVVMGVPLSAWGHVGADAFSANTPGETSSKPGPDPADKTSPLGPGQRIAALDHLWALTKDINERALLVLGGTLAAILTTSYRRPARRWLRVVIAASSIVTWVLLALTIWFGLDASRAFVAAKLKSPTEANYFEGLSLMNDALAAQLILLKTSMLFLVAWLGCFVWWWVSDPQVESASQKEKRD